MRAAADVFKRVYSRLSKNVGEFDFDTFRKSGGKVMDLLIGVPSLKALFADVKLMFSLIKDFKTGAYRDVSWATIGAVLFAIAYLVAPIDLIPDFIPIIGLMDDLAIFRIAIAFIQDDLSLYRNWKAEERELAVRETEYEMVEDAPEKVADPE